MAHVIWRNERTHRLVREENGFIRSGKKHGCYCGKDCVIGSAVTNLQNNPVWDLTPFAGTGVGIPGGRWVLRDVGEAHDSHPEEDNCSGIVYGQGRIDESGRLVGLPSAFHTRYNYNGYMVIQQFYGDGRKEDCPCAP